MIYNFYDDKMQVGLWEQRIKCIAWMQMWIFWLFRYNSQDSQNQRISFQRALPVTLHIGVYVYSSVLA